MFSWMSLNVAISFGKLPDIKNDPLFINAKVSQDEKLAPFTTVSVYLASASCVIGIALRLMFTRFKRPNA